MQDAVIGSVAPCYQGYQAHALWEERAKGWSFPYV